MSKWKSGRWRMVRKIRFAHKSFAALREVRASRSLTCFAQPLRENSPNSGYLKIFLKFKFQMKLKSYVRLALRARSLRGSAHSCSRFALAFVSLRTVSVGLKIAEIRKFEIAEKEFIFAG